MVYVLFMSSVYKTQWKSILLVDGAEVCERLVGGCGIGMREICWWMGQGYE
jgi:hypothetical protein